RLGILDGQIEGMRPMPEALQLGLEERPAPGPCQPAVNQYEIRHARPPAPRDATRRRRAILAHDSPPEHPPSPRRRGAAARIWAIPLRSRPRACPNRGGPPWRI